MARRAPDHAPRAAASPRPRAHSIRAVLPPGLALLRARIDRLDGELLALLARRAELVRRAARLRAQGGRLSRDLRREAELVHARRAAARRAGLDADAVEHIFRAVLALSHRVLADG